MKVLFMILLLFPGAHAGERTEFLGNWESPKMPWSKGLQGLCHNEKNIFIVQKGALWKVPRTIALRGLEDRFQSAPIPQELQRQGADHLGDCDVGNGLVFVPLEGILPLRILIFDAESLELKGAPELPSDQTHAPWVTVDPRDGTVLTGGFGLGPGSSLRRFSLTNDFKTLIPLCQADVLDENGMPLYIDRIQGVDVMGTRNKLWLVSETKHGGLYGFNLTTYRLEEHVEIGYRHGFPRYEELEGLDTLEDQEAPFPGLDGNIIMSLMNKFPFGSGIFLKSFLSSRPSGLE